MTKEKLEELKAFVKELQLILPPPSTHIPGTIPRRWVTATELEEMYPYEELKKYDLTKS